MLGYRQDFDMGITHIFCVRHELLRKVEVAVIRSTLGGEGVARAGIGSIFARLSLGLIAMAIPAAQVHLIDIEGLFHVV